MNDSRNLKSTEGSWLAPLRRAGAGLAPAPGLGDQPSPAEWIALERLLGTPLSVLEFLTLAVPMVDALGQLHQAGVVHGQLTPAAFFCHSQQRLVKVVTPSGQDGSESLRELGSGPKSGSFAYFAPEQIGRWLQVIDLRADLYSLGIIFYEMLTGALPFSAQDAVGWVHAHLARTPPPLIAGGQACPESISRITLKLLAKEPADRYQTVIGLRHDLELCRAALARDAELPDLSLGSADVPSSLEIPRRLYGRDAERQSLVEAFRQAASGERPPLVLIAGYSGIGKTALVRDLYAPVTLRRGAFISGKFGALSSSIPYATVSQAFRGLVDHILGQSDEEIAAWRRQLTEALGNLGQLLIDVVPSLEIILGPQPAVVELPPAETQNRFNIVFGKFLEVVARREHPLVIFFDDLQWADMASLRLLEHVATNADQRYLLLVGAYRSNEVDSSHPLTLTVDSIRAAGAPVRQIDLAPMTIDCLKEFLADVLHASPEAVTPMAGLLVEKTGGNPFFVIQFLKTLGEERLIERKPESPIWQWDVGKIKAKSYTDNVVDFMVARLSRLPGQALAVLRLASCLGNRGSLRDLALVCREDETTTMAHLSEAARIGLVLTDGRSYRFLHDRVQQAAYSTIAADALPRMHLDIGRLLLSHTPAAELDERLFEIVGHLNLAQRLLDDAAEKTELARLNLKAGKKAKASAAYPAAAGYMDAGSACLPQHSWRTDYELAFELHLELAECRVLIGSFEQADALLTELLTRAVGVVDQSKVYLVVLILRTTQGQMDQGVASAIEALKLFGLHLTPHPTWVDVTTQYDEVWKNLGSRSIEGLLELPLMESPETQAAMRIFSALTPLAFFTDGKLHNLHTCHLVNLSIVHGNFGSSAEGYCWFGLFLTTAFKRYDDGYHFGELGYRLIAKHGFHEHLPRVSFLLEILSFWTQPVSRMIELIHISFEKCLEAGDLVWACFSCNHLLTDMLVRGDHLEAIQEEAQRRLDFVRKVKFHDVEDIIVDIQRYCLCLRGLTTSFGSFDGDGFDTAAFEAQLTPGRMTTLTCWHYILKMAAKFLAGDIPAALAAAPKAEALLWSSQGHVQVFDYCYFHALTLAAACDETSGDERERHFATLRLQGEQLTEWATHNPATFGDKNALVTAEIARLSGQGSEAMRHYEAAIRQAHEHGFIQNEALSYELAARYYERAGFAAFAEQYLRKAWLCYRQWGALGKVRQLESLHPRLTEPSLDAAGPARLSSALERLDVASVLSASQSLSEEILPARLAQKLMRLVVETSGAETGYLVLVRDEQLVVEAEVVTGVNGIAVHLLPSIPVERVPRLPTAVVNYTHRTAERVLIPNAREPNAFISPSDKPGPAPRSILCLPVLRRKGIVGMLYLENNLISGAFPPERLAALEILASQAAISLENAALYGELQAEEEKLKATLTSMTDGVLVCDDTGRVVLANDALSRILGVTRDDVLKRDRASLAALVDLRDAQGRTLAGQHTPLARALRGETIRLMEVSLHRGGKGPLRHLRVSAAPIWDKAGTNSGVVLVAQDVTELTALDRLKEEFLRAAAHELKTPLMIVSAHFDLLNQIRTHGSPDEEACFERMGRGLGRLAGLVEALVDVSLIQLGQLKLRIQPFDLGALAVEIGEAMAHTTTKHRISVIAPEPAIIPGDRLRLGQVLTNLLQNAIKHSPQGGPIELRVELQAQQVLVSLRDQGVGIPLDKQDQLFRRFFRAHAETAQDFGGMGVGLFISQEIVQAHGGKIWFTSQPGAGSTFFVSLPRLDSAPTEGKR
jgi:PAS domain S-box-containing protein